MSHLPPEFEEIYLQYDQDPAFADLRETAAQLVRGDGWIPPDVVFVGEAPGADEDLQGYPFVGKSGQLLDELMADAGMSRRKLDFVNRAYITNIVKYRPPNNRDPLPAEIEASIPYLAAEIRFLKPKVLVTLGRHSLKAVWPHAPTIGKCHGTVRIMPSGLHHVVMYHPAYGIYAPRNRSVLKQDFVILKDLLKDLT